MNKNGDNTIHALGASWDAFQFPLHPFACPVLPLLFPIYPIRPVIPRCPSHFVSFMSPICPKNSKPSRRLSRICYRIGRTMNGFRKTGIRPLNADVFSDLSTFGTEPEPSSDDDTSDLQPSTSQTNQNLSSRLNQNLRNQNN